MKNIKRGKVPILAAMVIIFLVGFFVLTVLLYDFVMLLYTEALIVIDIIGNWLNEISR